MTLSELHKHLNDIADEAYRATAMRLHAEGQKVAKRQLVDESRKAVQSEIAQLRAANSLPDEYIAHVDESFSRNFAEETDSRQTTSGKELIRKYAKGQLPLGDLLENAIIPLGEGERGLLKYFDAAMLMQADSLRYQNLEAVQHEYGDWRHGVFQKFLPVLQQYGCVAGQAYERGLLF